MIAAADQRDPLTGALPRSALAAELSEQVETARRTGRSLSLCVIDLDHFKSINDAFGHARGDQVLAAAGALLRGAGTAGDLLFRYGGDEFVLLLPGSDEEQAAAMADRLLALIRAQPVPGPPPLTMSLSIGVAGLDANASSPEALFARADARVYTAKRLGRGRVVSKDLAPPGRLHFDEGGRLLERESALGRIHTFLAAVAEDGRGVLTISGPPAGGRTRLLQETARAAELLGYAVLPLRGHPGLRTRVYGALADAADGRAALAAAASRPEAIAALVCAQSARPGTQGLLVAVDDLTEVDAATIAVLAALLRLSSPQPIALALVHSGPGAPRGALNARVTAAITVAPFSPAARRLWLRGVLAAEPPEALTAWLDEQASGLPGRLRSLLTALVEQGQLALEGEGWTLQGAPEPPAPAPGNRLPGSNDAFIGRVAEIQRLKDLLEESGAVSLVGPGGVGKSRLALQVAGELVERYPDGVVYAGLTRPADPGQLAGALAEALDLRCGPHQEQSALVIAHLAARRLLLVLDNLEGALDFALLAGLRAAPGLTLLTTSREPPQLPGAVTFRLHGLETVRSASAPMPLDAEAAQLFVQRVRAAQPGWQADAAEYEAVRLICRAVEGMPLGLELAAAWVPALSCAELAALLTNGAPWPEDRRVASSADRDRLRDALAAFWGELGGAEQQVLRGLSVFSGGCTGEAAVAVAGASRFLLAALVDRAFLRRDEHGRYLLHELLRQYGKDQLSAHPTEPDALHDRHLNHYLALARHAQEHLQGPDQGEWLARLAAEQGNMSAALEWGLDPARARTEGLELATLLVRFWQVRGALAEGRAWLARGMACAEAPAALQARGLGAAGRLAHFAGDLAEAATFLSEAVRRFQSLDEPRGLAHALNTLGLVRGAQGDEDGAFALYQQGLDLLDRLGDRPGMAAALNNMGLMAWRQADLPRAATLFERCLQIERELGDRAGIADSLDNLGGLHGTRGEWAEARALFEEALATHRALENLQGEARSLANLAEVALREGEVERAGTLYRESLRLCRRIGNARGMIARVEGLALVAAAREESVRAATLFEAALRWRAAIGAPPAPHELRARDRACALLRDRLGEPAYRAACEVGRTMLPEQAVALALQPEATTHAAHAPRPV